jgi:hypothetical protein
MISCGHDSRLAPLLAQWSTRTDTLVAALLMALALFIAAITIEKWNFILFVHDGSRSQSPLEFNTRLNDELAAVRQLPLPAAPKWYVVVDDVSSSVADCTFANTVSRGLGTIPEAILVHWGSGPSTPRLSRCVLGEASGDRTLAMVSMARPVSRAPALTPFKRSVLLTDADFRVVYGRSIEEGWPNLSEIVELFARGTRTLPGSASLASVVGNP